MGGTEFTEMSRLVGNWTKEQMVKLMSCGQCKAFDELTLRTTE